jgi:hypothetical protein
MKISNDQFSFLDECSNFFPTFTKVLPQSMGKKKKTITKNEEFCFYKNTKLV